MQNRNDLTKPEDSESDTESYSYGDIHPAYEFGAPGVNTEDIILDMNDCREISYPDDETEAVDDKPAPHTITATLDNGTEILFTEIDNTKPEKTQAELEEELQEHYRELPHHQPISRLQSTKSSLDIFDETVDAITNEEIRILLTPLKTTFRDEAKSKELNLVIHDFQKLATAFKNDPNIEQDKTKNIFNQTLTAYNEYDKTKLSLRVKTILSTVFGGLIGAAIGFGIGVFAGGLGCIPAMCIGAAVGCVLGAGSGMATSLTLFGKKYDHVNGAALETTDKNKSTLTKKLNLAQTLNTIQKRFF